MSYVNLKYQMENQRKEGPRGKQDWGCVWASLVFAAIAIVAMIYYSC